MRWQGQCRKFILPNNSNIILSARQAAEISDKPIHVIPTKTIPQGLAALIAYNPENDVESNEQAMLRAMQQVKSGQITYAVRDSKIDDIEIREGNIMGLNENKISVVGENIAEVTKQLLDNMLKDGGEIVTILYGSEAKEEDTEQLLAYMEENHSDVDVRYFQEASHCITISFQLSKQSIIRQFLSNSTLESKVFRIRQKKKNRGFLRFPVSCS